MIDKRMKTFDIIIQICCICFIILIITGIVAPRFFKENKFDRPHYDPVYYKIHIITSAINVYKFHTGMLPKTLEDLITCPTGLENSWQGPYLKLSQTKDPWGNLIIYEPNAVARYGFDLISYGADGQPGGKGINTDSHNDR